MNVKLQAIGLRDFGTSVATTVALVEDETGRSRLFTGATTTEVLDLVNTKLVIDEDEVAEKPDLVTDDEDFSDLPKPEIADHRVFLVNGYTVVFDATGCYAEDREGTRSPIVPLSTELFDVEFVDGELCNDPTLRVTVR